MCIHVLPSILFAKEMILGDKIECSKENQVLKVLNVFVILLFV